ncbi:PKD domain-containing protein [Flavobacterium sp.]|uniref:PKD domain-containing protein n=1 Tax=Flavobacterium sp. TaxID=239 RepID=UPI003526E2B2
MSNTPVTTCAGTFYDSGGASGSYGNTQTFTKTFCPSTPGSIIRFEFTEFDLENNADFLYVYDGDNTTAPLLYTLTGMGNTSLPFVIQATGDNTSGCLTFVFISDTSTTATGWNAIVSCQVPCQTIVSELISSSPAADSADDIIKICVGDQVTFNGSGTFETSSAGATYTWDFDNGDTLSGETVTYTFTSSGVFIVNLLINDPLNCVNSNRINQVVQVSDPPTINFSTLQTRICKGQELEITATIPPQNYSYECTPPVAGVTFLPDGSGVSYQTSILVDCYEANATLTNINQIVGVCLNMEHSYLGDLQIEIISPTGASTILKSYGSGGGGTFLGDANDAASGIPGPGIGFDYCFAPTGTTTLTAGPTTPVNSFPPGGNAVQPGTYLPTGSFNALLGSPLNGFWTIKVTDNLQVDDGYIFSWGINFDPSLTPPDLTFSPTIESESWSSDPTIVTTNNNVITVASNTPGFYTYTYTATNSFGCTTVSDITIEVVDNPDVVEEPIDFCDYVLLPSGEYEYNLNNHIPELLASGLDPFDYEILFFLTEDDAINQVNQIPSIYATTIIPTTIYVTVLDFDLACPSYTQFDLCIGELTIPTLSNIEKCDSDGNDVEIFDLTQQNTAVLGANTPATDYTITYHTSQAGADDGTIDLATPFDNFPNTVNPQTIYVRLEENSTGDFATQTFELILYDIPVVDEPTNVAICDNYTLPALTVGNYFDGSNGTGTPYNAGDVISTIGTTTLYVYAETGTTPNCTDEHSFTITIYETPIVDEPTNVAVCDNYTLPALTVGNYFDGSNGTGTAYNAGDVISTIGTTTLYVYAETGTTPNCTDEHSFTITIAITPDVPTITTTPPSCSAEGTATITNYDPMLTYSFTPNDGTNVGAGGVISGMVAGTNYTVTAENASGCVSAASLPFSIAAILVTPDVPMITTTPPSCSANGSSAISNYDPMLTYLFTPNDGTSVGAGGVISGMVIGTSYTVTASNGSCTSGSSLSFSNAAMLASPIFTSITSNTPICAGENAVFTFTGTANATINFMVDGTSQSAMLDASGSYVYTLTNASSNVVVTMVNIQQNTCTVTLTDSETVVVNPLPTINPITNNGAICAGENAIFTIEGTPNAFVNYDINGVAGTTQIESDGDVAVVVMGATVDQVITLQLLTDSVTSCTTTLTNTATISVLSLPTADMSTTSNLVCLNGMTTLTFTGTPNATVSFTDGTTVYTETLDGTGYVAFTTPMLTTTTTYTLTSVVSSGTPSCTVALSDSETISITPTPAITSIDYDAICDGDLANILVNMNNATGFQWQATLTNVTYNGFTNGDEVLKW